MKVACTTLTLLAIHVIVVSCFIRYRLQDLNIHEGRPGVLRSVKWSPSANMNACAYSPPSVSVSVEYNTRCSEMCCHLAILAPAGVQLYCAGCGSEEKRIPGKCALKMYWSKKSTKVLAEERKRSCSVVAVPSRSRLHGCLTFPV